MASKSTMRGGFTKEVMWGISAIPTGSTALSTTSTLFFQLMVGNPTASGITLTVTDNQAVPVTVISVTVPANSVYAYNANDGAVFLSGIKWQAGGAGLVGEIYALAKNSGA